MSMEDVYGWLVELSEKGNKSLKFKDGLGSERVQCSWDIELGWGC